MAEKGNKMADEEELNEETTNVEETDETPSLDFILDEEPISAKAEKIEEQPKEETKAPEEQKEEEAKPEEGAKPDEAADLTDEQIAALPANEQGFYKGMKKERGKRQEFEKKFGEATKDAADTKLLLQQATELIKNFSKPAEAKPETEAEAVKSFWDDPEAFIAKAVGASANNGQSVPPPQVFTLSEQLAKQAHEDYDTVYPAFVEAAQADPSIGQGLLKAANPGEYAYQVGKRLQTARLVQEAGGIEGYAEKIRAETLAGIKKTDEAAAAEALINEELPTSLGSRSAGGGMTEQAYSGPPSLEKILE